LAIISFRITYIYVF